MNDKETLKVMGIFYAKQIHDHDLAHSYIVTLIRIKECKDELKVLANISWLV